MVIAYSKSMDQPGKVANPARGQLNRENEYFPVQYMYLLLYYISAVYTDSSRPMNTTVCMYGHHISQEYGSTG